ncbi:MAG: shikimate dehydrogenase, partial [Desulfocucumaceae bacterium]
MHNAAFQHLSLNWAYTPFPVRPGDLAAAVGAVRALSLAGVNVTVPHKQAVIDYIDRLSPGARLSGAVNTIVNTDGTLTGHNTDGEGFIRALREEAGDQCARGPVLVIGAGGAARAVAVALALSGTEDIIIANRSEARARDLCELIRSNTGCAASFLDWAKPPTPGSGQYEEWAAALGRAKLLVQTTSLGMHPQEDRAPAIPYELVNGGQVAVDLVYNPPLTGFMGHCRAAGARVFNGMGMLLHQGAAAFELWTGQKPPLEIMRRALEESIRERLSGK